MKTIHIIGVPLDLGAGRRGVDMGPSALRIAGLGTRISALGYPVVDRGNVTAAVPETKTRGHERKRYISEISRVCTRLYKATTASLDSGAYRSPGWRPRPVCRLRGGGGVRAAEA